MQLFMAFKMAVCSSATLFLSVFRMSCRKGWHNRARLCIDLLREFTEPRNDQSSLSVFGGLSARMADFFEFDRPNTWLSYIRSGSCEFGICKMLLW